MIDIFSRTFITFFAIYGLTQLIRDIVLFFAKGKDNPKPTVVVKVLNAEESLEAVIRSLVWKTIKLTNGEFMPDILIVDMGSGDSTEEIAKRLCRDYSFISYTTKEIYEKIKSKEK